MKALPPFPALMPIAMLTLGRYFGAAKQLPGVKELFEKEAPRKVRTPWPFRPLSARHFVVKREKERKRERSRRG